MNTLFSGLSINLFVTIPCTTYKNLLFSSFHHFDVEYENVLMRSERTKEHFTHVCGGILSYDSTTVLLVRKQREIYLPIVPNRLQADQRTWIEQSFQALDLDIKGKKT